jgi:hypothetical protein
MMPGEFRTMAIERGQPANKEGERVDFLRGDHLVSTPSHQSSRGHGNDEIRKRYGGVFTFIFFYFSERLQCLQAMA